MPEHPQDLLQILQDQSTQRWARARAAEERARKAEAERDEARCRAAALQRRIDTLEAEIAGQGFRTFAGWPE
jgi:phage-related minor tail protein